MRNRARFKFYGPGWNPTSDTLSEIRNILTHLPPYPFQPQHPPSYQTEKDSEEVRDDVKAGSGPDHSCPPSDRDCQISPSESVLSSAVHPTLITIMMSDANLTFAGEETEVFELYEAECSLLWESRGLSGTRLIQAQFISLRSGLRGAAQKFASGLSLDVQRDFTKLSAAMNRRFPWVQVKHDRLAQMKKSVSLKQGLRTFQEYVDEAYKLQPEIDITDSEILVLAWVEGLRDPHIKIPTS